MSDHPSKLLDPIKLPSEEDQLPVGAIGYYSTFEGAKFLKFAYTRFLAQLKIEQGPAAPSHGTVAGKINDWNPSDQKGERERTEATLRRWVEKDQHQLWLNDPDKNTRVLERLEIYLMKHPAIAQILTDRRASIRTMDFSNALALFFYGHMAGHDRALLRESLKSYCGVFQIWKEWEGGVVVPNYYQTEDYYRISIHDALPLLVIHEFAYNHRLQNKLQRVPRRLRSGLAYVTTDGRIIRYMVSQIDPRSRWIETYDPRRIPDTHKASSLIYDYYYSIRVDAVDQFGIDMEKESKDDRTRSLSVNRIRGNLEQVLNGLFVDVEWNIPL